MFHLDYYNDFNSANGYLVDYSKYREFIRAVTWLLSNEN